MCGSFLGKQVPKKRTNMNKRSISVGLMSRHGEHHRFGSNLYSKPGAHEDVKIKIVGGEVVNYLPHVNNAVPFSSPLE